MNTLVVEGGDKIHRKLLPFYLDFGPRLSESYYNSFWQNIGKADH